MTISNGFTNATELNAAAAGKLIYREMYKLSAALNLYISGEWLK
jgi:hypothetical protein